MLFLRLTLHFYLFREMSVSTVSTSTQHLSNMHQTPFTEPFLNQSIKDFTPAKLNGKIFFTLFCHIHFISQTHVAIKSIFPSLPLHYQFLKQSLFGGSHDIKYPQVQSNLLTFVAFFPLYPTASFGSIPGLSPRFSHPVPPTLSSRRSI